MISGPDEFGARQILRGSLHGHAIDSDRLRDMRINAALAANTAESGWLQRLTQGVYLLARDFPTRGPSTRDVVRVNKVSHRCSS
ncbi:AbiEi antitoxin N-terminal domain-containing protein [Paraburkholderia sp. XV]|uniref:AbiEi antitoxin N-terminal domain-containing protein n=1 Tax=Paraburkholderia sp. XV TaxID=2831520 RepID=UPI001CD5A547|nr:AbiEi antitoxin N-terminal domain-containing protein [Paraburkholderia sp. XV]